MASIPGGTRATVTVSSYCLDLTEVTVSAYGACVAAGACTEPDAYDPTPAHARVFCNWHNPGRALHPVNCVDWGQAVSYCGSRALRLPTEEEWEWAARNGPTGATYPWGEAAPTAQRLNACGAECPPNGAVKGFAGWKAMSTANDGFPETAPVGSFPAGDNRWGVHDLAGNVWEWTASNFDSTGAARVRRGGGWDIHDPTWARATLRLGGAPEARFDDLGFRCAR
jgi:formylglycine-generating enzyme required for sulfatase activity